MSQRDDATILPSREEFLRDAKKYNYIPVVEKLYVDAFTPIGIYETLAEHAPGSFILESLEHGTESSRWSIIGVSSVAYVYADEKKIFWNGLSIAHLMYDENPILALKQIIDFFAAPTFEYEPPVSGGLVGFVGYDFVKLLENIGPTPGGDFPTLGMLLASDMAIMDHQTQSVYLVANAINANGLESGAEKAWDDAVERITVMKSKLASGMHISTSKIHTDITLDETQPSWDRSMSDKEFCEAVSVAKEKIADGETFQIVISQKYFLNTTATSFDVYRSLRILNPSPYMFFVRIPTSDMNCVDFDIVGSSPEALATVRGKDITMNPIAGTRRRSNDPIADQKLETDLLNDPKERAEHIMLVDLARNDLGRVCESGSVVVDRFMFVQRFSHVMHIVSTVKGKLSDRFTFLDALFATFPAGTLTGAPKIRAMQIIDEIETEHRDLYGGVVGYIDFKGNMDMAIAIRTAVIREGNVKIQSGAGVVADSVPEAENQESKNKAMGVYKAIQIAENASE